MYLLGIDLGGTHIKIALVDSRGIIFRDIQLETQVRGGPVKIIQQIKRASFHLISKVGLCKVKGVGVGVAGDIDQKVGKVRFSPNLGWRDVYLGRELKRYFKMPVFVDNDANAAAWGAYILEAKKKVKNLIAITLGTGVGGGIIMNGNLYHGAEGSAGEIGHVTLYPGGIPCSCGSRGCLECYVGAPHLVEQARTAIRFGQGSILNKMVHGNLEAINPIILELAAKKGDELSSEIWNNAGKNLGIAIAGLINLLNPEMIILAGGTSRAGKLITDPMWKAIKEYSFASATRNLSIIISKHDKNLGVVGAALLAVHKLRKRTPR